MTAIQIQSQTITLAYMIIHLASDNQIVLKRELDSAFSPLQNSYLILVLIGMDVFPLGALRPFEPWDIVEIGLIGLLNNMPDRTLTHAEQSSLVAKLECQHHQLRRALPIVCPEVDLECVAGGLFPIFCKMSHEQQARVVMNNGFLREKFPVLRKSIHHTPFFLVTLFFEVVDNTSRPITDLYLWGIDPVGVLVKGMLMELFQEPTIAPGEMCMVLAAFLALSETYFLGIYRTSRRGECPMRLPYRRPPISDFYQWVQEPSSLHLRWDVIETLICSFHTVFNPEEDDTTVPAMHKLLDSIKPATEGSMVPTEYYQYWRLRQRRHSHMGAKETLSLRVTEDTIRPMDQEEMTKTVKSRALGTRDLMNAIKDSWTPRSQYASCPSVDNEFNEQSVITVESVQEEPPPAYLLSSDWEFPEKHDEKGSEAEIENASQQRYREESSQTPGRNAHSDCVKQGHNNTGKSRLRRIFKTFRWASGS